MNPEEARNLLGIRPDQPEEEWDEVLEALVFRHRREALSHGGIPAWITHRLARLQTLQLAAQTLGLAADSSAAETVLLRLSSRDPLEFLRSYERASSDARLGVSNACDISSLMMALKLWQDLLFTYAELFPRIMASWIGQEVSSPAQRQALDTAAVIHAFQSGEPDARTAGMICREATRIASWTRPTHGEAPR